MTDVSCLSGTRKKIGRDLDYNNDTRGEEGDLDCLRRDPVRALSIGME